MTYHETKKQHHSEAHGTEARPVLVLGERPSSDRTGDLENDPLVMTFTTFAYLKMAHRNSGLTHEPW